MKSTYFANNQWLHMNYSYGSHKIYDRLILQCGNIGYLAHFPVAKASKSKAKEPICMNER